MISELISGLSGRVYNLLLEIKWMLAHFSREIICEPKGPYMNIWQGMMEK